MRFDTPVYFQSVKSEYNPQTGDYDSVVTEEKRWASVTDAGIDTINLVYGQIKQGVKTVRLQSYYHKPVDRVRIGSKVYSVDGARPLRLKYTLVVSEVQGNGKY